MEYRYRVNVEWSSGQQGVLRLDGRLDCPVAIPPEFGGPEGITSPEDLLVASAAVCYMTTFLTMGQKVRAEWTSFTCRGEGVLGQRGGEGGLSFTRIELSPVIGIADESKKRAVLKAVDLASRYCLVTNSLNSEILVSPEIVIG